MADTKITALTALTAADPANDVIPIVDVSDTSMAASGTTKKISVNNILGASGTATLASATITGDLTVRTDKLAVRSTGVGIGTTTPNASYILDLTTAYDARARQWIADSSFIGSGNLANGFTIRTLSGTTDGIRFLNYSQSTEFMRIDSSGNVGIGVTPSAGKGCLQLVSGINFPATQVASSDANTLDDYEEGTWTPVVTAVAGTLTSVTGQTGTYTKIGRMVTATGFFTITTNGTGSSAVALAGLPFANGGLANIGVGRVDGTTGNMFQVKISASASTANIWKYDNTYPAADGAQFPMTLVYYV